MKPIIMDIREISLSKEVYDKKPALFFSLFIYGLFALVSIALAWAYFGRIDVVIRAQGVIRPYAQPAVVLSVAQGEITGVLFYEGKRVERGDILFTVNSVHLENDRNLLLWQLDRLSSELAYLKSLSGLTERDEANRVLGQISNIGQEIAYINLMLISIDAQIDDFTVRANISGRVNVQTELAVGGFITSGTQVLQIIPERGDLLRAYILISNSDIGQISEGMTVYYDIAAMPSREFGEISGQITRIAADVSVNHEDFGYFLVESKLADVVYYDSQGSGMVLRAGMFFEARIVIGRQRILFYLLR